ncbi:MAG: hypothetical protein ABL927_02475 [Bdellovibrionales bacterium]
MGKFVLFFTYLLLSSCATNNEAKINDLSVPMPELQKIVIASLPVGQRSESTNGRNYVSKYFISEKGTFVDGSESAKRYYAEIEIQGDRRPYSIQVNVYKEQKIAGSNTTSSIENKGLARVIIRRIQSLLYKRRDNRNVIDDFRVF